jgi:predicted pyridoxine 5'-phosphate oxidase superfamily flavin-nucleotide-binding protein
MPDYPFDLNHIITDEASLRSQFHDQHQLVKQKCQSRLDIHSRQFIEQSLFVYLGTQNLDGKADVSPHGDPVGFVKTLEWDIMLTNEWG